MMLFKALLCLLAYLQLAQAYYPWIPTYRCILDHTCIVSKRELKAQESQVDERASLKIVQRLPENNLPHDVQLRGLAARLTKKYQRSPSATVELQAKEGEHLAKRASTYSIVSAVTPTQTNSAGIDQDGTDYSYFAQVLLGSANTQLYMLLDSGAGQSWVMGTSCTSLACKTHDSFGPADSTTYKAIDGSSLQLEYGSGSITGTFANDSLTIAGLTLEMTLGIANVTSNDFLNFPMDGILGLSRAPGTYPNFIQTLVSSKSLKSNLFAVNINRAADGGPNLGELTFGATDPSKYTGSFSYTSISPNAEADWAIPIDALGLLGNNAGITGKLAYIDTGTSYIFAPPADVAQFHGTVPGAKSVDGATWTVPCTTTTPLTFTFSGVVWSIPTKDWVGPMANGVCTSNVFGQEVVPGQWLLGDTFLKNVYTVFDIDGNRIGFAAKSTSASAVSSGTATSTTGGQTSSSIAPPSAAIVSASGTSGLSGSLSNTGPAGSSTGAPTSQTAAAASTTSGQSAPLDTGTPGLNGHQTSDSSGTAAAESSISPTASPTKKSTSAHLDINLPAMFVAAFALVTVLSY